jgi:hypothetical protein
MNLIDFRNKFLALETDNNLFSAKVYDFEYWKYIRIWVYYELQDKLFNFKKGENKWQRISHVQRIKTIIFSIYVSLFKNPLLKFSKKDVLIFTGSRRIRKQDKDFDIYFDEFIDNTDKSVNVLEDYFQGNDYREPYNDASYIDFLYIFQKIILRFKKIDNIYYEELNKKLYFFEKEFKIKINNSKIIKIFENHLVEHLYFRKIYKRIIQKASPKIVMETVSYGTWKHIFNEEAKKLSIPVIELQHGFMGAFQIPYNFKKRMDISSYPNYIFTFGEFWNRTTEFPIEKRDVISCGFPHFENNIKSLQTKKNGKFTILFISQPTVAKGMIKVALSLAEILDDSEYEIIYKLHPQEYSNNDEIYTQIRECKNIYVTDENSPDLYHYFKIADAQVGVYSTAIIEGLGFKLNTFIVKFYGYEWMKDLYENNYAKLIENADEIAENIRTKQNIAYEIDIFWQKNAINNLLNELNKFFYE